MSTVEARAHTTCMKCGARYDAHDAISLLCPDGSGRRFKKHASRVAASQSFNEREVMLLNFFVDTLLRGGDVSVAMRNDGFPSLVRKTRQMKERIVAIKAVRAAEGRKKRSNGRPGAWVKGKKRGRKKRTIA